MNTWSIGYPMIAQLQTMDDAHQFLLAFYKKHVGGWSQIETRLKTGHRIALETINGVTLIVISQRALMWANGHMNNCDVLMQYALREKKISKLI